MSIVVTHDYYGVKDDDVYIESGYFVISKEKWNKLVKNVEKYKLYLNRIREVGDLCVEINPYECFQQWKMHDISTLETFKESAFSRTTTGYDYIAGLISHIKRCKKNGCGKT